MEANGHSTFLFNQVRRMLEVRDDAGTLLPAIRSQRIIVGDSMTLHTGQ